MQATRSIHRMAAPALVAMLVDAVPSAAMSVAQTPAPASSSPPAETAAAGPLVPRVQFEQRGSWLHLGLPRAFEWARVELPVPNLPDELAGVRLLHLSDLHLRHRWASGYDRLIELVNRNPPDLICFTGDIVEDKRDHRPALPTVRGLLPALKSRLGTYAILGNHDNNVLGAMLPSMGIHLLATRPHLVPAGSGDAAIELIGFPGIDRRDLDVAAMRGIVARDPRHLRVALCHFPDLFEPIAAAVRPDLYLTGHTHGGQVCLPGGWPLITHDRSPRRYAKGIHRRGDTWFIASRGFGAGKFLVRAFCPPQVMELRLVRAE